MISQPFQLAHLHLNLRPFLALAVDIAECHGGLSADKHQIARIWLIDLLRINGLAEVADRYADQLDPWIHEAVRTKTLTGSWLADVEAVSVASIVGALKRTAA